MPAYRRRPVQVEASPPPTGAAPPDSVDSATRDGGVGEVGELAVRDGSPGEAPLAREGVLTRDGGERYRRLPTGAHGLAREEVERDQRERLRLAMIELIAKRGYQAVRILDLTKLAHVSRPTFYNLYTDKEELLLAAYEEIAERATRTVLQAYSSDGTSEEGLGVAIRAFFDLAASEPDAMSLFLLGAFGAGPKALERRKHTLESLEGPIQQARDPRLSDPGADLTVKVILGGIREVAVARLHHAEAGTSGTVADELVAWASTYPPKLPTRLRRSGEPTSHKKAAELASERARRARGRLPSGRHDLPRQVVVKSQRERIVDATAAIVAEKGLAGLTIPEIASRANVSHETFYEMYATKHDAFLGAQKVGMHQALGVGVAAWEAQMPDWPRAIAAGLRAVIDYIVSEPAHAHLSIVDAFGASPETVVNLDELLRAFATYFDPGYESPPKGIKVPAIAAEAVVGGVWQVLHHYVDSNRIDELPDAAPQLTYALLTPFLGPKRAAEQAVRAAPEGAAGGNSSQPEGEERA
jgi:AcrR family transcriptional regulator